MKLILSLLLISNFAFAASESSKYSMRHLARASNFLLAMSDAVLNNEDLMCGMNSNQPQALSLELKVLIDEKIKALTPAQKDHIYKASNGCDQECTCDIYSLALENDQSRRAGKLLELVNAKARRMKSEDRLNCAQKFKDFCSSKLFKSLLKASQ